MATDATLYYYETAHSLLINLENEGHTDEWIRLTVRLMMLNNIFLTETEHLLCAAIKGEMFAPLKRPLMQL